MSAFKFRGLDTSLLESPRFQAVTCVLEKPSLGITEDVYQEVSKLVDMIAFLILLCYRFGLASPTSSTLVSDWLTCVRSRC